MRIIPTTPVPDVLSGDLTATEVADVLEHLRYGRSSGTATVEIDRAHGEISGRLDQAPAAPGRMNAKAEVPLGPTARRAAAWASQHDWPSGLTGA